MVKVKRNIVGSNVEFDVQLDGNVIEISEEFVALVSAIKEYFWKEYPEEWCDTRIIQFTQLGLNDSQYKYEILESDEKYD